MYNYQAPVKLGAITKLKLWGPGNFSMLWGPDCGLDPSPALILSGWRDTCFISFFNLQPMSRDGSGKEDPAGPGGLTTPL